MARRGANGAKTPSLAIAFALAFAVSTGAGCSSDDRAEGPPADHAAPPPQLAVPSWPVPAALPGSPELAPDVRARIATALALRSPSYEPRTEHVRDDGAPVYTNRLILESSPYLRQHAHNPVDWRPWGDEAFEEAKRLGRPVFLSIGYSTCHWCHVMERESFEDEEIAAVLNSQFVPVKVDREERPDVDAVYMTVVQLLTGSGGWPMTLVLTPDREPFFGGTYFPARRGDRGSRAGLLEILPALSQQWADDPAGIAQRAGEITSRLRAASAPRPPGDVPDASALLRAQAGLAASWDQEWGGFGGAPKFPRTVALGLLLRYARRTGDPVAAAAALGTLDHMAAGGIRDRVGGGFHRYATDREWRIPHFEKMLYDNALLAVAYLDAYQVSGDPRFAEVAREILDYLRSEMTSPEGGFYSATDADSAAPDGRDEEGRFFTWTPDEIAEAVGSERAPLVAARYGVTAEGNLEGRSVLYDARSTEDLARESGEPPERVRAEVESARDALDRARARRPAPLRDEKVITAWNGLAISAFARGARVLRDPTFAQTAAQAARFVLDRMTRNGRLARSYIDGRLGPEAVLEDLAFLEGGLLDLYEATFDPRWLTDAIQLQATLDDVFWDEANGGYFATPDDGESLLVRPKDAYDGALPSGNAAAAMNLLRLHALTADDGHRRRAERLLAAFASPLRLQPGASPHLLSALDFYLDTPKEILLIRPDDDPDGLDPFLEILAGRYLPNAALVVTSEGEARGALAESIPWIAGKTARDGRGTAYVCENRVCALPTTDPAVFAEQLAKVRPYPEPTEETTAHASD